MTPSWFSKGLGGVLRLSLLTLDLPRPFAPMLSGLMTRPLLLALTLLMTASVGPSALADATTNAATTAAPGQTSFAVLPASTVLTGAQARARLLVQQVQNGRISRQLTQGVTWASSNSKIVEVNPDGFLRPIGNGSATIVAALGSQKAEALVTVEGFNQPHPWSFRNHVLPVLAKSGCSSGACHGALAGKGGFRLSLRGYDPKTDHFTITRQARGRRIELSDPGRSLILAKPSGALPHKGGLRLEVDSPGYRVLSGWIAEGATAPAEDDPRLAQLEVFPSTAVLQPGDQQQLVVRARYSDGRVEDVTSWAKFSATNQAVAEVNEQGKVTVVGHGEGAVSVWFSSQIIIARVSSPFRNDLPPEVFTQAARSNFLDELILEKLQRLNLPPSPRCRDQEFIRRAFVDTLGVLPTAEEVRAFLENDSAGKREELIDDLLQRPEFVDYWTYRWSDILLINGTKLRPAAVKAYYLWIRQQVKDNTPWDQFVRQVITAKGSSLENGATNFYALHQSPEQMTENVSQAFLSLSLECAKCHNHPLEKWTNDQYYGMANLFARVRAKGWGGDSRNGNGLRTLYVVPHGELVQPLTGKPQPPRPLDAESVSFSNTRDRREYLADWLTSPENPYFARAITNRVWANFFGVGLVEQVDDLRVSNPASDEKLLTAAADYLIENEFNLKALMRAILRSEAYQRSSKPLPGNAAEKRFYSRYYPRRMMAEVLLDAISQVTGVPSRFEEIVFPGADRKKTDFYPQGTRALQVYDSAVASYFLKTFGRNPRNITCECERSNEPSMVQVLHIANGETLNQKLRAKQSRVTTLLSSKVSDEELIEEIYLSCLARRPTAREAEQYLQILKETPDQERRAAVEDLFWAVISSKEFLFNH